MSSLGGIHNLNGAPIDNRVLSALGDALAVHGPDGGHEVCSTSVGIAYRGFHTNQESRLEKQPFISRNKHILAWDGRLDNRDELTSELRHSLEDDRTDVAIVMEAYLEWGVDFLRKLIGDFSLSLWNPYERKLLLARDPVGTRPLYYHINRNRIIWSSELAPLVDLAGIQLEVDDEYIAGFLANEPDPWLTPYRNIFAITPGYALTVQDGQAQNRRFWGLHPDREILYASDAQYEEHFRYLFCEAVRCRLRGEGRVWAELSGGLDSSSIVCVADQLIKNGETQTRKLATVSQVFDESPTSDERKFIHCIEEQRGKPGHHLREDDYRLLIPPAADRSLFRTLNPLLFASEYHRGLCEAMHKDHARVLLSGQGGDEMLGGNRDPSPGLADLLFEGRLLELNRSLKVWSAELRKPYLKLLWQSAVVPILPPKLHTFFKQRSGVKAPAWFCDQFAKEMCLHERMLSVNDIFGCRLPSSRDQAIGFISVVRSVARGHRRQFGDIEVSYPYLHLPLVEFLQAIPFDQRVRPGQTRSLMRRSLRGVLPDKIAERKGKGNPSEVICRAFMRERPWLHRLFTDARVCLSGYVDARELKAELERTCHGCPTHAVPLLRVIALEFWLRTLEQSGAQPKQRIAVAEKHASWSTAVHLGEKPVVAR
jgi:asparagine synthase (glutamine-hydrolysing)